MKMILLLFEHVARLITSRNGFLVRLFQDIIG